MFDFSENEASSGLAQQFESNHGPSALFARFLTRTDRLLASRGLRVTIERDFDALLALNQETRKTGNPLTPNFSPEFGYDGTDGYWLAARNRENQIVATLVGRVYDMRKTTLAAELESLRVFYVDPARHRLRNETCVNTTQQAREISGRVLYSGGAWVRPDARGTGLTAILPRISKVYAIGHWYADWAIALLQPILVRKGVAQRYGITNVEYGVHWTGMRAGELEFVLGWLHRDEIVDDLVAVERDPTRFAV